MSYATIKVKNLRDEPHYLQFTANDSHVIPARTEKAIMLVEPTSIYYVLDYLPLAETLGLEFSDSEGTLLTKADVEKIKEELDTQNGVTPYRDLPIEGALEAFVSEVEGNAAREDEDEDEEEEEMPEEKFGTVTSKYLDESEAEIAPSTQTTEKVGTSVEVTPVDVEGYITPASQTSPAVTEEGVEVKFTYEKVPAVMGKVISKFVDQDAMKIAENVEVELEVGTKHVAKPITITGYNTPSPTQKTVTVTEEPTEVEFVYQADE